MTSTSMPVHLQASAPISPRRRLLQRAIVRAESGTNDVFDGK